MATNCYKTSKCVKWANKHKTKDCPIKTKNENPLCANCGENHAASSKNCRIYKKVWDSKFNMNKITDTTYSDNKHRGKTQMTSNQNTGANTYASKVIGSKGAMNSNVNINNNNNNLLQDIKELFADTNLMNIMNVIKKTINKLKTANDGMTKIAIIIESVMEIVA